VDIGGVKVLAARLEHADAASLRDAVEQLKSKLGSAAIVLGSVDADQKVVLIAGVTADQISRVKAGDLVNFVAQQVGGRGGGRPELAQAGGQNPASLDDALASVTEWARAKLGDS
jgi:alanyl-tRNA synthetase